MNDILLNKHLDDYLKKIKINGETEDLIEREEREKFYSSYTKEKLLSINIDEFYEYIGKLWAMIIWGNKKYRIDQLIADNGGFEKLKSKLVELIYGNDTIASRWDNFKNNTKGFGPAMMSEILCYVYPNDCMLWNRTAESAYQSLEIPNIPLRNYQMTGKKYVEMTEIAKEIQKRIIERGYKNVDLLFVDYFFWDQLRDIVPVIIDKKEKKESVVNNKSYHNEIIDYIKNIGNLLGYNTDLKRNIKNSGKIADAIWEFNVGNLGKIRYVFEVQDKGDIDSLLISLANASQDVAVQAVVAISDEEQINKMKQHSQNIRSTFNGKLKFWDITEIERAYTELSNSMEIINKAINVVFDK